MRIGTTAKEHSKNTEKSCSSKRENCIERIIGTNSRHSLCKPPWLGLLMGPTAPQKPQEAKK